MLDDTLTNLTNFVLRTTEDESRFGAQLIEVYVTFQLFGLFGILITLATVIFSRSIPRHALWFSFAISWVISTVAYTLLLWGGYLSSDSKPPFALCLIQSAMIYASPPLTAFTTLALVTQVWYLARSLMVSSSQTRGVQSKPSQTTSTALLVLPYLLFVVILVGNLILGSQDPNIVKKVSASGMYCSFTNRIPGRVSTALCALLLIPVTTLEVLIFRVLHHQWPLFKRSPFAQSMVLRVALFTLIGLIALTFSLVLFFDVHHGGAFNVVISLLPVSAVLIFGTQGDILRAWMFWKKKSAETVSDGFVKDDSFAKMDSTTIVIGDA